VAHLGKGPDRKKKKDANEGETATAFFPFTRGEGATRKRGEGEPHQIKPAEKKGGPIVGVVHSRVGESKRGEVWCDTKCRQESPHCPYRAKRKGGGTKGRGGKKTTKKKRHDGEVIIRGGGWRQEGRKAPVQNLGREEIEKVGMGSLGCCLYSFWEGWGKRSRGGFARTDNRAL